jgi:PIN like domain
MTNIYLDENLPPQITDALNILESKTGDGFVVISMDKAFGRGAADEVWIPRIGAEQGVVITQDMRIYRNKAQRSLYEKHGVGIVFLPHPSKKQRYRYWELVEQIVKHWQEIRTKCSDQRPFSFEIAATKNQMKRL